MFTIVLIIVALALLPLAIRVAFNLLFIGLAALCVVGVLGLLVGGAGAAVNYATHGALVQDIRAHVSN